MKLPRDIDGSTLADALCRRFAYRKIHQVGSHIVLQCEQPTHHRLAIPDHRPLRVGTLNAILRAVANAHGLSRTAILDCLR